MKIRINRSHHSTCNTPRNNSFTRLSPRRNRNLFSSMNSRPHTFSHHIFSEYPPAIKQNKHITPRDTMTSCFMIWDLPLPRNTRCKLLFRWRNRRFRTNKKHYYYSIMIGNMSNVCKISHTHACRKKNTRPLYLLRTRRISSYWSFSNYHVIG